MPQYYRVTESQSFSSGYSSFSQDDSSHHSEHLLSTDIFLQTQDTLLLQEQLHQQQLALQSWETLQQEVLDLNELFVKLQDVIEIQRDNIDVVYENIEQTSVNVHEAKNILSWAEKCKVGMYPVAGAVIGGCLAGPVGLLTGLKVGGLALIGGSVLGFTGGKFLKKKQEENSTHLSTSISSQTVNDKKVE